MQVCIQDVPFSIVLNGEIYGYFHSKSGLRQGWPLFPLLFMVLVNSFSWLLDHAISLHTYTPFSVGNTHISHLLIDDDLLVTGLANSESLFSLDNIFVCLKSYMGLSVNCSKSYFYISRNSSLQEWCSRILAIPFGNLTFKYLGLLLISLVFLIILLIDFLVRKAKCCP